jgi:hypothetical protein
VLRLGFEPTIPALERTKTLQALDCTAAVIGSNLDIGFIDTTRNCNTITDVHSTKHYYKLYVFVSRCFVAASNNTTQDAVTSSSVIKSFPFDPCFIASAGTAQKTFFPWFLLVACLFFAAEMCLPRRCLAVAASFCFSVPAFSSHVAVLSLLRYLFQS